MFLFFLKKRMDAFIMCLISVQSIGKKAFSVIKLNGVWDFYISSNKFICKEKYRV